MRPVSSTARSRSDVEIDHSRELYRAVLGFHVDVLGLQLSIRRQSPLAHQRGELRILDRLIGARVVFAALRRNTGGHDLQRPPVVRVAVSVASAAHSTIAASSAAVCNFENVSLMSASCLRPQNGIEPHSVRNHSTASVRWWFRDLVLPTRAAGR